MFYQLAAWIIGVILVILGTHERAAAPTSGVYDDRWAHGELTSDYPEFRGAQKKVGRWVQRGRLLAEIKFLNTCREDENAIVVYAITDGRHMPLLVEMYPRMEFHLYNTRPFSPGLDGYKNIRLSPYYGGATANAGFTDAVAEWYRRDGQMCLGHTGDGLSVTSANPSLCRTLYFIGDTERNSMRPRRSMLKQSSRGIVHLPCWGAETYVTTDKHTIGGLASVKYKLAWYNHVMRRHDFQNRHLSDFGISSTTRAGDFWSRYVQVSPLGFDFVYELQILADYLGNQCTDVALHSLVKKINDLTIPRGARFQDLMTRDTSTNTNIE